MSNNRFNESCFSAFLFNDSSHNLNPILTVYNIIIYHTGENFQNFIPTKPGLFGSFPILMVILSEHVDNTQTCREDWHRL